MATHELYLLHLGRLGARNPETGEAKFVPVPGYLIRTASNRIVLMDSGNPASLIGRETSAPWGAFLNETRPEDDVVNRLAELGIAPEEVDLLVSSHFHFDHCGRHEMFAAAGIASVVQRQHLEAARADPQRFDPALWDCAGMQYQTIDGDVDLEPGLRLIVSSGHAIGHQSVYVETADGPVLLAIDAINQAREPTEGEVPDWYPDPEAARRSWHRLLRLAADTGAFLIFGHDAEQWATLPKSPTPFRRP
jgi:N-acyl homoserine lactone hydrolase